MFWQHYIVQPFNSLIAICRISLDMKELLLKFRARETLASPYLAISFLRFSFVKTIFSILKNFSANVRC